MFCHRPPGRLSENRRPYAATAPASSCIHAAAAKRGELLFSKFETKGVKPTGAIKTAIELEFMTEANIKKILALT